MILSAHPEQYKDLLPKGQYEAPVLEVSAAKARQRLNLDSFSFVIIAAPLSDEYGIQTANEIASVYHQYVLLLVPREKLDQAEYQCREATVFVCSLPVQTGFVSQALSMLEKASRQNQQLQNELIKVRQKLQDEKTISHCKLKLIENYHWSEEKAHSYLGKAAMDHSTTRVHVARVLLNKMEAH